ncbi:hypothetical protein [Lelliottia wanjuensis]|uniref:hypothetical protein n=1 Tax=Lelliottia wanjuensis TaxID=3050585 RepID=UPI00254D5401|nr:hypothetical protein [Lelliottia sp. V86_10]MDK9585881.1 hypothetical protein [Lelliottia sp. V86_10]
MSEEEKRNALITIAESELNHFKRNKDKLIAKYMTRGHEFEEAVLWWSSEVGFLRGELYKVENMNG